MPRITNIEVAQKNLPVRIILLALAIVIAIGAFAYGFTKLLTTEPGWTAIEVTPSELNCGEDFVLNYNLGAGETSATAESKALKTLYGQLVVDAYQIFNNDFESEELHNIRYLNEHINQEITVDPALYQALGEIVKAENRNIYLAPVYAQYLQLLVCENDLSAAQYDPQLQPETKAYITDVVQYANNPEMINIEILGENKVRLNVSAEYLSFAEENEIEYFLDFSWMKNAFIADYIAQKLTENGFSNGYLASYDGFTRNLYAANSDFGLNLFYREGQDVSIPATIHYPGGCSAVMLRDFPLNENDRWCYYAYANGRIANLMIDPADGNEKSAVSSMVCYSKDATCSQILMSMIPLYIADALNAQGVNALKDSGVYSVYPDGKAVYTNDSQLKIELFNGYSKMIIE